MIFIFVMSSPSKVYSPSGNVRVVPARKVLMRMCRKPHNAEEDLEMKSFSGLCAS